MNIYMNATKKNLAKVFLFFIIFTNKSSHLFSDVNKSFFNFLELYESAKFSTPKAAYQKDDLSLSTFSFVYGARITLKEVDLRFYQWHSAIKFSQIQSSNSIDDYHTTKKNPAWSVELNADELNQNKSLAIPLQFLAGSLNF